jgi:Uma2 family endonuclease
MLVHEDAASGPYTWEDFIALDEDDLRELVDGQLVEIEVPKRPHEHAVAMLVVLLGTWTRERKSGRVLASGYKVRISPKRGVMPDVQLFRSGNAAAFGQEDGLVEGRPDLVVEVLSRSSRRYDRVVKLAWYATIGVPEYWIVDPDARTLERLVLASGRYAIAEALAADAVFRPEGFDGLAIPLAELWEPEGR